MDAKALINQGVEHQKAGRHDQAQALYQQILAEQPKHASALHLLGLSHAETQNLDKGLSLIKQAVALQPNQPIFRVNLGVLHRRLGQFDDARACFREVVKRDPNHGEAWAALAESHRYKEAGDDLASIVAAIDQVKDRGNLRFLHFAAGKILDDLGDYDLAFQHYSKGNALGPQDFKPEAYLAACQQIAKTFTPDFFAARSDWGLKGARPVFLIGMPRSGSSLLERILSQHSGVAGVGEVADIPGIVAEMAKRYGEGRYPACVNAVPSEAYQGFAGAYLQRLAGLTGEPSVRTLDKNLYNRMYAGTVRLMFPEAVIIHCRRDPLDVALSCFFQNFSSGQSFSFNLEHIAASLQGCDLLIDHWKDALPGGVVEADYDELIQSPEQSVRKVLDACSLAWEPGCLSYADNPGYMATASSWQARQPLYKSSLQRWKNYEKQLEPVRKALERR